MDHDRRNSAASPLLRGSILAILVLVAVVGHLGDIAGFIVDRRPGHVGQFLLHQPADLEFHGALLWHLDWLQGLGVLRFACLAQFGLKDPEIAELQPVATPQFADDFIEELLHHALDLHPPVVGLVGDAVDEFFLGDGRHVIPESRLTFDGQQTYPHIMLQSASECK